MILVQLRDAIVSGVKSAMPALLEVKPHGGRFDLDEIKKTAARSPSARVGCLGLREITFEGAVAKATSIWGVFVVANDQPGTSRDTVALTVVAGIGAVLPDNCWGLDASVDGARQVRADNLFSKALDDNGIALWAITFNHQVDLARVDATDLDDFLQAYIEYDLAPTDGTVDATDQIELPQE
jgi:hypothetical protein